MKYTLMRTRYLKCWPFISLNNRLPPLPGGGPGWGPLPLRSSRLFLQRFSRKVCRDSPRRASDLVKRIHALYTFGACAQICSQQICLGARKSPKNMACIPRAGLRRAQPAHAEHSALALCSIPRSPYATPFQLGLFRQHFNRYAILLRA